MARVEKNAAGEDVPVDTPEYGCIVIDAAAVETAEPAAPKSKGKADKASDEGAN